MIKSVETEAYIRTIAFARDESNAIITDESGNSLIDVDAGDHVFRLSVNDIKGNFVHEGLNSENQVASQYINLMNATIDGGDSDEPNDPQDYSILLSSKRALYDLK